MTNRKLVFYISCKIKYLLILFKLVTIFVISMSLTISFDQIYASTDPILITQSTGLHDVIFDGKWTNEKEWKPSSHNLLSYNNSETIIHLRTAHQENFIYIFVDPITDLTLDNNLDEATVCFDAKNDKNLIPDNNDFCFSVLLNESHGILKQGNLNGNYEIMNEVEFIAISNVSDENDRYTKILHPSYEFRIPIELLERSDNYGFYLSVYDASLDKFYSWPENLMRESSSEIPSPSEWGDIISPDKSLPEMHLPLVIFTIILIQTKAKMKFFHQF